MPIRKIVIIDEDKCNGCGECVTACAEAAIEIIDGKAKLISEIYCDGLGACLGQCPQDAITIEDRQAEDFDEEKTNAHIARQKAESEKPAPTAATSSAPAAFSCPGQMAKQFSPKAPPAGASADVPSQLAQWPVQLTLLSP
ncbi:MAG: 4Fe-4S binding protein, partial [Planctomycetes bacterium]|nr:4Fe-4S binding protein [Planctomycetota bacterium]